MMWGSGLAPCPLDALTWGSALRGQGARPDPFRLRGLVAAALLALSACVTTAPRVAGSLHTGRLSVHAEADDAMGRPAHTDTGSFELSGSADTGQLVLTSPLGTVAARASWNLPAHRIELDTGSGVRRYPSLDAMMQDALGESLPLAAMFDWLEGKPWPNAPATPLPVAPANPTRRAFEQLGWTVDLTQFADQRLVTADRATPPPALRVRVKLDAPEVAASAASAP